MKDDVDWRMKNIITIAEDVAPTDELRGIEKGTILKQTSIVNLPKKKTLILPVPSLTALYISNSQKSWALYRDIRKESGIDKSLKKKVYFANDSDVFDVLEALSTSIISAYTAVESFCNDSIPENHEYWHSRKNQTILEKSDKKQIERCFSTTSKLRDILPSIYDVEDPKGKIPWRSYIELKRCRDSLIHAKSHETRSVLGDKNNLWDKLFKIQKPHLLAKDVFSWYLSHQKEKPSWFLRYPK